MKILINGAAGAMGRELRQLLQAGYAGAEAAALVDARGGEGIYTGFSQVRAEGTVLDFSFHTATAAAVDYATAHGLPLVVGTTGHTEAERAHILAAADRIPLFYSGNISLGIAVLCRLVKDAVRFFPHADVEILEAHHKRKDDAPSGTALMIADAAAGACGHETEYVFERLSVRHPRDKKEIGISAVRGGTIVGEHEIIFAGHDEIMEIKHTALSRDIFAQGAVEAAKFMATVQAPGLYDMSHLVK